MSEEKEKRIYEAVKDPFLKPVILSGIFITLLSIIFAPGIFLWAGIGGYIAVRLAFKITKEIINIKDGLILGLMSGLLGGTCLDIFTVISFKTPENQRILLKTLEKNLPNDLSSTVNINEILPSILLITSLLIIIISCLFSVIGSYIGVLVSKRNKKNK